jgi:hypothetical protein
VVDGARERREAIRQLAELRRGLTAAEDALTEAHAAMKRVEIAFDAASAAFTEAEQPSMPPASSAPRPGGTVRGPAGARMCCPATSSALTPWKCGSATVAPVSAGWPGVGGGELS